MNRWVKRNHLFDGGILIIAGIAGIAGIGLSWFFFKAAPVGNGFVAKYLCSSTFISKRNPETVFAEDIAPVNPLAKMVTYKINSRDKSVTTDSFGLFERKAIYREGCGCSLVIETTEEEMRNQKLVEPEFGKIRPKHRGDLPWPLGNQGPVNSQSMGIDMEKLEKAIDAAFSEPDPENPRKTRAVVIVYNDKLIAERYAPGFNKEMPLLGWSMSKSITNSLVGILVKEGKLDVMQTAPVPEWQKDNDQRGQITIDQLLRMSSGLKFEEVYAPLYDATHMLYGSYNFAVYAAGKPLETEPDGKWYYSSGTANIIARIVRQTAEKEYKYYYSFLYDQLFDKIGMYSAVMEPDSSGTFVGSSYTFATPRDWARFGLLFLQDGLWQGERILPEGWVKYSTTPTPGATRGEYGAHFWLNAGTKGEPTDRRWPRAPRDAYAALGFQEQKVIVIPSRKLVLVRFGATSDREAWDTDEFIKNVLEAFPT